MNEKRVKICGITSLDVAEHAINFNADYLGFIFYAKSPRNIFPKEAEPIIKEIKDRIATVAVTVDPSDSAIQKIKEMGFSMLQLHGSESTDRVEEIKNNSDLKIIKTFGINQEKDFDTTKVYEDISDYFLFDSKPLEKDLPGGNAKSFEWKLLESYTSNKDFFLSGGLTVENVETAVNSHYTNFFDVSSGVESSPGVKDKQKITDFINKIKK